MRSEAVNKGKQRHNTSDNGNIDSAVHTQFTEQNKCAFTAMPRHSDNNSLANGNNNLEALTSDIRELNINSKLKHCSVPGTRNMSLSKVSRMESDSEEEGSYATLQGSRDKRSITSRQSRATTSSKASNFFGKDSGTETDEEDNGIAESLKSSKSQSQCSIYSNNSKSVGSRVKKLRSGMYDKPNEDIMIKLKWPHNSLDYAYRSRLVEFNRLTYNQYIAGETKIISMSEDIDEMHGRLRLMNKIAYAMDDTGDWQHCREYYAAILVAIELGEESWTSSFRRYDYMIPRTVVTLHKTSHINSQDKFAKINRQKVRIPEVVFCKDYQKGKCALQGDHTGRYKDEKTSVMLRHICARCWLKDKQKTQHPETSSACPLRGEVRD